MSTLNYLKLEIKIVTLWQAFSKVGTRRRREIRRDRYIQRARPTVVTLLRRRRHRKSAFDGHRQRLDANGNRSTKLKATAGDAGKVTKILSVLSW